MPSGSSRHRLCRGCCRPLTTPGLLQTADHIVRAGAEQCTPSGPEGQTSRSPGPGSLDRRWWLQVGATPWLTQEGWALGQFRFCTVPPSYPTTAARLPSYSRAAR